mgnify:CR=1 FL=1
MSELLQSHRVAGYVTAHATDIDGRELVILQTAPHKEEVVLAHMLRPKTPAEVQFDVGVELTSVVLQARFLGLDRDTLAQLFALVLEAE